MISIRCKECNYIIGDIANFDKKYIREYQAKIYCAMCGKTQDTYLE